MANQSKKKQTNPTKKEPIKKQRANKKIKSDSLSKPKELPNPNRVLVDSPLKKSFGKEVLVKPKNNELLNRYEVIDESSSDNSDNETTKGSRAITRSQKKSFVANSDVITKTKSLPDQAKQNSPKNNSATSSPNKLSKQTISSPIKKTTQRNTTNILQKLQIEKLEAEKKLLELRTNYDILASDFEELKELTITKAEKTFEEYKKSSEQRFDISQKLISHLKQDLKEMKKEKMELIKEIQYETNLRIDMENKMEEQKTKSVETEKIHNNKQKLLEKTSENSMERKIINLYRMLTGVKVKLIKNEGVNDKAEGAKSSASFECMLQTCNGILQFKLERNEIIDSNSVSYIPTDFVGNISDSLPDYMLEEIQFNYEHMPMFFGKLISKLYDQ